MLSVDVVNNKNQKVGTVELDSEVFDRVYSSELLHEVVKWQLASKRQGTHMTKTKGLVSGGGKKPFKQKGTGGARQGSTRSILMPGGGTAFGPQPKSYAYQLPKKIRRAALSVALSEVVRNKKLIVLDDIVSSGKTKDFVATMKNLGLQKSLVIDHLSNDLSKRASGNLVKYKYSPVAGLNVYDVLKYSNLVLMRSALDAVVAKCKGVLSEKHS